jgi:hypothetical protein
MSSSKVLTATAAVQNITTVATSAEPDPTELDEVREAARYALGSLDAELTVVTANLDSDDFWAALDALDEVAGYVVDAWDAILELDALTPPRRRR